MLYLSNAFSLQMLSVEKETSVKISPLALSETKKLLGNTFVSVVGHQDTANVLTGILGMPVKQNRESIILKKSDTLIVAQLTGGRLPEGATKLPEGYTFKFVKVIVQ